MRYIIYKDGKYSKELDYKSLRRIYRESSRNYIENYFDFDVNGKNIHIKVACKKLNFIGRKAFLTTEEVSWFVYKNGKFYGFNLNDVLSHIPNEYHIQILKDLGIEWIKDICINEPNIFRLACKRNILKSILCGTIYNEETLIKAIAKRIYRIDNVSWKLLRDFFNIKWQCYYVSLFDLKDFTTNLTESLKFIINIINENEYYFDDKLRFINEFIKSAKDTDSIINLKWSKKRMEYEHQKHIDILLQEELETKSNVKYYDEDSINSLNTNNVKVLDNEASVFYEAQTMHHCIYNSYNKKIENKLYMGFHMTYPEVCTFGIKRDKSTNEIILDQIYLKYDKEVKDITRKYAEKYIDEHSDVLNNLLLNFNTDNIENVNHLENRLEEEILPF